MSIHGACILGVETCIIGVIRSIYMMLFLVCRAVIIESIFRMRAHDYVHTLLSIYYATLLRHGIVVSVGYAITHMHKCSALA